MEKKVAFSLPDARTGDIARELAALRGCTVLALNPSVHDFAWFDLWSKPVGLLCLLQHLKGLGNKVHFIDCLDRARLKPLPFGRWKVEKTRIEKPEPYRDIPRAYHRFGLAPEALRERLRGLPPPDVVLVTSGMTYWYPGVFEGIKTIRTAFPDAVILLGGIYARLCPEHALKSGADFIQTAPFVHPDSPPAFDLYESPGYGVLITSWGCPMRCSYCAAQKLWPDFRQRPLDEIFADLDYQMTIPTIGDIAFYDDALLLNKENHFYPLCEKIRRCYPDLRLHTPNGLHVAQMDEECCRTLFRTGFQTIRLSLEGIDPFTKETSSRKVDREDYARAVRNLRSAGYPADRIETYILTGLPGQNPQDVLHTVDYVLSRGGRPKIAEFSPIPGTPLYEVSRAAVPEIGEEPLLHNNSVYAPYIAKTIGPDELQALKDNARTWTRSGR